MPDFGRWTSNGGDPSLNDVNRVDQFFDALGAKQTAYSTDRAEAELAFLLADWRDDVRDAPVTVPVTARDATTALREGLSRRDRRSRTSLALVGSVAAAVLCIGGFGVAVFGSNPGDALYGMRGTIFGGEQVRDEQVTLASQQLQQVQQLIDQGQWQQAQDKLAALSTTVQGVEAAPAQKQDLIQQWNALTYKVVEQDPAATLPPAGEPLPTLSNSPLTLLPVPAVDTTTTSSSTSTTASSSTSTTTSPTSSDSTSPTSPTSPTSSTSTGTSSSASPSPSTPTSASSSATPAPEATPSPSPTPTSSATAQPGPASPSSPSATPTTPPVQPTPSANTPTSTVATRASTTQPVEESAPSATASQPATQQPSQERRSEPATTVTAPR